MEENLINWGELSRLLSGSRSVITRNNIPKKHIPAVNKLIEIIGNWRKEYIKPDEETYKIVENPEEIIKDKDK